MKDFAALKATELLPLRLRAAEASPSSFIVTKRNNPDTSPGVFRGGKSEIQ